jgi:hypothetical protein
MARSIAFTIAYDNGSTTLDLFKVIFSGDGSYQVTAPYHPHNRAMVALLTVNYAKPEQEIAMADAAKEVAVVDDDNKRLKLTHHPDGFIQFSGQGIRSGRLPSGEPKGLGVVSWPLIKPTLGPSFGVTFSNPTVCGRPSIGRPNTIVLPEVEIEHMRSAGTLGVVVTGYYFPVRWREFVYRMVNGTLWIPLLHPKAQAIKLLRVMLASKECGFPGLIGVEARPMGGGFPEDGQFLMGSSTGNLRRNADGDLLGDQLVCMYPHTDTNEINLPSLAYPLPSPEYTAPPGTTEP